jgi:hypothetical protein
VIHSAITITKAENQSPFIKTMETSYKKEEDALSNAVSTQSIQLSRRVRRLADDLRDMTAATPFAADSLILANEVGSLCNYVEQLHGNVETLLAKIHADAGFVAASDSREITAEDKKAMEIQREIHELHPTVKDTIKALFMWRDSPDQRLRDDK